MLSSPPKRRKTSETTAAAIDASQSNQQAHENNNRVHQRRPSFQSPTKASLARSHPDILARAISRSPTRPASKGTKNGQEKELLDSRTFGLRDRKALRPSLTADANPIDPLKLSPRRRSSGVAAFAAPPRRVSRRIAPSDLAFGTPEAKPQDATNRPPEDTPEDQLASELGSATGGFDANNIDDNPLPLAEEEGLQEPDLPLTPTQLGLEKPPGRPKGLSSSSPTAQYEKRARRRMNDTPKPSPLKLKNLNFDAEPSDLPGAGPAMDQGPVSESVLRKQKTRKELSVELQQLKDDIAELENWTEKLNKPDKRPDSSEDLGKLISLLSSENAPQKSTAPPTKAPISSLLSSLLPFSTKAPKFQQEPPPPTNPFALKQRAQTKQHLTVFAPLTLTTHSSKVSASKQDSLAETHKLTLSAGPPFPPKLYNVTVTYKTNPETQSLTSISVPDKGNESNIPDNLGRWINTRLSNPLLKLDVSGLCWGINRYWEASISRAQIWYRIESRHSKLLGNHTRRHEANQPRKGKENSSDTGNLSTSDLRRLIPHLDRATMIFAPKENPLQVLLSCSLTIDEWASEPQLLPEISISTSPKNRGGSSRKVEQEAKKLFYALLKGDQSDGVGDFDADAVVRATEGVLGVLFGLDTVDQQQ